MSIGGAAHHIFAGVVGGVGILDGALFVARLFDAPELPSVVTVWLGVGALLNLVAALYLLRLGGRP